MEINKEKCYGCGSCVLKCPVNAIEFSKQSLGHLVVEVNNSICVDCNLCLKVCPIYDSPTNCIKSVNTGWVSNSKERKKSSSGGIANAISTNYLTNGGIVYGAAWDKGVSEVRHVRVNDMINLEKLTGSKYVESKIVDILIPLENDLKRGEQVLFIGLPCQISGVKKYLLKKYSNLLTIELVCHGVPSAELLKEEIDLILKGKDKKIDNIRFRTENGYEMEMIKKGDTIFKSKANVNKFYRLFLQNITLRDSCYTCNFAQEKRNSDILIGDYYSNKDTKVEMNKGISIIVCYSEKGEQMLSLIENDLVLRNGDIDEIVRTNPQFSKSSNRPLIREKFEENYTKFGYEEGYKKTFRFSKVGTRIRHVKNYVLKFI